MILLVAGASGEAPYLRVFCEQHEDLLCERDDGLFEAFQVKTRGPEGGYWEMSNAALRKSIKRFVALRKRFGPRIQRFVFVSNSGMRAQPVESEKPGSRARDPWTVLRYARDGSSGPLDDEIPAALDKLATECDCDRDALLAILRDTRLVPGPSLNGYDAQVAHDHLTTLPECTSLSAVRLNGIRDELIHRVYSASSLSGISPAAHWMAQDGTDGVPATVEAKRVSVEIVREIVKARSETPLRFLPSGTPLDLVGSGDPTSESSLGVLTKKMRRGGIEAYLPLMKRLALSAEARLMEIALGADPSAVDQLAGVVETECGQAQLDSDLAAGGAPYGKAMLQGVFRRLETLARDHPARVHREDKNCLTGIAAILSEDCRVWWSDPFELAPEAE